MYEDNQSAIAMTKNPQFHGRDIKLHFIREQVTQGTITLKYCPTTEIVADILSQSWNFLQTPRENWSGGTVMFKSSEKEY